MPPHISPGGVLLVTPWYVPILGGIARVADRLHRGLTDSGLATHLLVCQEQETQCCYRLLPDKTFSNVWNMSIPSGAMYRLTPKTVAATTSRGLATLRQLRHFIHRHAITTILVIYPFGFAWPWLVLRQQMALRLITSYHGTDILNHENYTPLHRWISRQLLLRSDAIIVSADHLAIKARQIVPDKSLPIRRIANCADTSYFIPPAHRVPPPAPTLIHISNFAPKKRTLDIVAAFARADLPADSRLLMVGAGVDHDASVTLAARLGLEHRIKFLGSQPDVRSLLWQSDALVMASDEESGPLAILEAMACGLPWIGTPWGIAEMLEDRGCGLVVPCRDIPALAAAMSRLLCDQPLRQRMGHIGRRLVEKDFSLTTYVQKHVDVIDEAHRLHSHAGCSPGITRCSI